jgi:hypothetical protein
MVKITDVIAGPFHLDDIPQEDWPPYEIVDDGLHWLMEVETSEGSLQMYLRDFDMAYDINKHFEETSEPLELEDDEDY